MNPALRRCLLIPACLLVAGRVFAQDPACTRRSVPISIEKGDGKIIEDSAPRDLIAKIGGKEAKIIAIEPDQRPHRMAIIVDASGSMRMQWSRAIALALGVAKDQLPNTEMALLVFNDDVFETIRFSDGRPAVVAKLEELKLRPDVTRGSTALYSAMLRGARLMGTPTSADVLYIIGDGEDNASDIGLDRLWKELEPTGVRVFASLMFEHDERPKYANRGRKAAGELAQRTGGEVIEPFAHGYPKGSKEVAEFAERMNAFHRRMLSESLLQLETAKPSRKTERLAIEFAVKNDVRFTGARITYPEELAGCTAPN